MKMPDMKIQPVTRIRYEYCFIGNEEKIYHDCIYVQGDIQRARYCVEILRRYLLQTDTSKKLKSIERYDVLRDRLILQKEGANC